jgi:carbonic anhydrase/acetyltransferase-like protein (isoleucine patch superfamily)
MGFQPVEKLRLRQAGSLSHVRRLRGGAGRLAGVVFDRHANDSETFMERRSFNRELVASTAWIAPSATVLGDVRIGEQASIWFGAVLRGDVEYIQIGSQTNVQDLACLHCDTDYPCVLGTGVTVGHAAVVHGASVGDYALIGIGAIVLNGAVIGSESLVAAGTVIREGQQIPPRVLVAGVPGKIIRELTEQDICRMRAGVQHYVDGAAAFLAETKG